MAAASKDATDSPRELRADERRLEGVGLHGGRSCAALLRAASGPTTLGVARARAPLGALEVARVDRATTVRVPARPDVEDARDAYAIAGVEHLLAAVHGLDAFAGLEIEIEGGEVPLVDGCAIAFCAAIEAVRARAERAPPVRVREAATIELDDARYDFWPAPSAGASSGASDAVHVEVAVDYPAARFGVPLAGAACWRGDRADFLAAIAPARTFGARRELEALRARGLAAHLPAGAVVGLDVDEPGYAPRDPAEPVRHKLLDLLGDLALLGGRFVGGLRASHPSHAATAAALREARARGVLG